MKPKSREHLVCYLYFFTTEAPCVVSWYQEHNFVFLLHASIYIILLLQEETVFLTFVYY